MNLKKKIFLASHSPRRLEILKKFNIASTPIANKLDPEPSISNKAPIKSQLRKLSLEKATVSKHNHKGLILGADTIVLLQNTILGKPKTINEAIQTLSMLSGKQHQVISGFGILDTETNTHCCRTETTTVEFNTLTKKEITKYCTTFKPLDKAGSYGIQEIPKSFVNKIIGCYYNVMGLPINTLLKVLKNYAIV